MDPFYQLLKRQIYQSEQIIFDKINQLYSDRLQDIAMNIASKIEQCTKETKLTQKQCINRYQRMFISPNQFNKVINEDQCLKDVYQLDRKESGDKVIIKKARQCHQILRRNFIGEFDQFLGKLELELSEKTEE